MRFPGRQVGALDAGAGNSTSRVDATLCCRFDRVAQKGFCRVPESVRKSGSEVLAETDRGASEGVLTSTRNPVICDAVSAAHSEFPSTVKVPGEAHAGTEIQHVRRKQFVDIIQSCVRQTLGVSAARAELQVTEPCRAVGLTAVAIVPEADIQGELPVYFPIVVDEQSPLGVFVRSEAGYGLSG